MHTVTLMQRISHQREAILAAWQESVFSIYPSGSSAFLQQTADQFANPVGSNISTALRSIFEGLVEGVDDATLTQYVEEIARITAVQDIKPADAVSFPILLKTAIIDELKIVPEPAGEWRSFDCRIDRLGLAAFSAYLNCREQINQIMIKEIKATLYERGRK